MIIRKYYLLILVFICFTFKSNAQTLHAFESAADKATEVKDHYSALKYLEKVLSVEPENTRVLNKYADACQNFGAYNLAETAFAKVVALDKNNSNALFGLASVEKTLGKYDLAMNHFGQFQQSTTADASLKTKVSSEIDDCEWALEQINNPDAGIIIERLGEEPNTENSEFGATKRGDTLYYSSFRSIPWKDKHIPERPIVKVMEAINETNPTQAAFNDPARHTAHTAFNAAGDIMFYNKCDYTGEVEINCELFVSKRNGVEWSAGISLPAFVNIPGYTTTQPNVIKDENGNNILYYVSDCNGGKGGLDIWKVKFTDALEFSTPENLSINTPKDDITPFFDKKTNTLFFSTLGYRSLGGFDIYKSLLKDNAFQTPTHLDIPFNSSFNDIYFAMQGDDWALFSSNRNGSAYVSEEACCYDIYKGTYLALKLETLAFSKFSGDPLDGVIFTLIEKPQVVSGITRFSNTTNNAEFDVKRDKKYMVIASKEGYKPDTLDLATLLLPASRKFVEKLYLEPTDFALNVRTFNQFYKSPLSGVSIRLLEMGKVKDERDTKESNETDLLVRAETQYKIIAQKPGFFPDTVMVSASELKPGAKVTKNLFLTPSTLGSFLPIALYFDNDQPDARSRTETTITSYDATYNKYINKTDEFIFEFTKNMSSNDKISAASQINLFFNDDVKGGYTKLDYFANNLGLFLENGYKVEIMVKGFASPLANPAYNLALTKRRIASVMNYFRKVNGGVFQTNLLSGQLSVSNMPYGETTSAPSVSDSSKDRRKSIYSVEASKERRAEILEIRLSKGFLN
jgi:tetratricopeptide (TPR) repeat protein/outer membrane protein OmpA-like peptidoglycan-associated protein